MKMKHVVLLFVVLTLVSPLGVSAEIKVEADKDNVVASKIEGTWGPDEALTRRVEGASLGAVTFKSDAEVAKMIPGKYDEFLKGRRIYLAGRMTLRKQEYPFILIEHKGNPHVVYFRQRGDDPMGDVESFNVMLVVAKDTAKDLLFIGGDFNNQPFSAYQRVVAQK